MLRPRVVGVQRFQRRNGRLKRNTHVYTRWDRLEGKRVVVKRHRDWRDGLREARVMRAYGEHQNLVRFCRFFAQRRRGYVVMEAVPGTTLRRLIARHGPLPPVVTMEIARAILSGLNALHHAGYVHGDIHAGNVIVSNLYHPAVQIIDMDRAARKRWSGQARSPKALPVPPRFAPEGRGRMIDESYDIYGVGYLCVCMLEGRNWIKRPWAAPLRTLGSLAARQVIRKALHPNPQKRYRSALEMAQALEEVLPKKLKNTPEASRNSEV